MGKKREALLIVLAAAVTALAAAWGGLLLHETRAAVAAPAALTAEAVSTLEKCEEAHASELPPLFEPLLPLASPFPEEPEEAAELVEITEEAELPDAEPEAPAAAPEDDTAASGDPLERVLELVNRHRAERGIGTLTLDSALCDAAAIRAREITGSFSHTRPDGSAWYTVSSLAHGENIVMGTGMDADSAMTTWMNSPPHKENILDAAYGTLGVGCYQSGREIYWVQLFGY